MPSLTTLITLVILTCSDSFALSRADAAAASPFDVLITQRQEQLYYFIPTLPADVLTLIREPMVASDAIAYFTKTNDELIGKTSYFLTHGEYGGAIAGTSNQALLRSNSHSKEFNKYS